VTSVGIDTDEAVVSILYRNYRGEVAVRRIRPARIWFGATSWHPQAQWVLDAIDVDKGAERSFALADILDFDHRTSQNVSPR
jgi:predicted DNA-binding transcriptional regulator YafY